MKTNKISNIIDKCESLAAKEKVNVALSQIRKAIQKYKNDPELLGTGAVFASMLDKDKLAQYYFDQALKVSKSNPAIYSNYGAFLRKIQRFDDSEIAYKKALDIKPESPTILTNLGNLYKTTNRSEEAEKCYEKSLILEPNSIETLYNYGKFLDENLKDFENAIEAFEKILKLKKDHQKARFHLSLLFLNLKKFREGWHYYDERYTTIKINNRQWTGFDISRKTLFIRPEQGVGDEVMFASIFFELASTNARIILACDKRLIKIYSFSFPSFRITERDSTHEYKSLNDDFDYQVNVGDLPKIFRQNIQDFKNNKPYLQADQSLTTKWEKRYNKLPHKLNIGISWRGGQDKKLRKQRSLNLESLLPILKLPANYINLQYGDHTEEIKSFETQNQITLYDWNDADPMKDLDNFAAQIKTLDLVISVDNSTVHFAGALGTKTLLMLPFHSDWRWAENRDDSYWYPNLFHLYRQPKINDWKSVIDSVADAVQEKIEKIN